MRGARARIAGQAAAQARTPLPWLAAAWPGPRARVQTTALALAATSGVALAVGLAWNSYVSSATPATGRAEPTAVAEASAPTEAPPGPAPRSALAVRVVLATPVTRSLLVEPAEPTAISAVAIGSSSAPPASPTEAPQAPSAAEAWAALRPELDVAANTGPASAILLLEQFLDRFPAYTPGREELYQDLIASGDQLVEAGELEQAAAEYRRALAILPDRAEASDALAQLVAAPTPTEPPPTSVPVRARPASAALPPTPAPRRAPAPAPAPRVQPAAPQPVAAPTPTKVPFHP